MSLRRKLQAETADAHRALDVLAAERGWFDTRAGYGKWLRGICAFHERVHRAIRDTGCSSYFDAGRFERLRLDMADVGVAPLQLCDHCDFAPMSEIEGLGLLYVTEGSRLGARVLVRRARDMGLDECFGARFLAAEAASLVSWQRVVAALDQQDDAAAGARAVSAGIRAFRVAQECLDDC